MVILQIILKSCVDQHFDMENKTFILEHKNVRLNVTVPTNGNAAITNAYCPPELENGGSVFIRHTHGELVHEFVSDCQRQVFAMGEAPATLIKMDRHLVGLMFVSQQHIARSGRLIFGDLLLYVDSFSYLLIADGFSDSEVRAEYPKATKTVVDLYASYVKSTTDLSPFT